ncbi:MAG: hypothetical protein K2L55_08710 [Muribaculaceae bacterium]|nr:hypothetical protein [Muribaculaceae bacterium]
MKQIYFLLLGVLVGLTANAQVVTTSPKIVQESSAPITITFHADKGNKGLAGLTASTPVYAHTGVILRGSDEWSHAPAWLDNSAKYKLTYVSANTWQLTIPSIKEYYGVGDGEDVARLAFVFRNATGSKEGKTESGGDIFVDVAHDGFAIELSASLAGTLLSTATPIDFTVNTTQTASIELFVGSYDTEPIAAADNATELTTQYTISAPGNTKVLARATSGTNVAEESIEYCLAGNSAARDYPGGVPKMGPVDNGDGTVTFCLAAPHKTSVMIVGSWNDYAYDISQLMAYQDYEGQRYFWVTVPGVADGNDYIYYFVVDNTLKVGDPYARLVLDPWNDKYIPDSVFPDMPEYPSAVVESVPLAVYNSKASEYEWKVRDFKGVDQSALVIYELLIRDFTGTENKANGEGTVAGVMSKLDYLQALGVNAIEFLPIMEFNGNNSWGYNTNFYFAPDKAYGTPDDYRMLFDEIHSRGMAVILDIVFNQTDGLHPWYQMYPIASNPFYNGTAPHAYSVLNDWNQDNPLVQQQFKDALKYWIEEYHVDGFRFDLVKGLGSNQSYNATYNAATNTWSGVTDAKTNEYNASRVARMKELHAAMKEIAPDAYFINENLAGAKEENEMAQDGETNWANINNASCQFAMGYSSDSDMNRFYAPLDSRTWGSTVSYAESHDEERMAYKITKYGAAGVKGNTAMSMRRLGSVAAMMLMSPGAHMIWQFQEFGANQTTKDASGGNDTSPKRVVWSLLDDADRNGLMECYRQLCAIRRDNPEMFDEGVATTVACNVNNWNAGRYITLKSGDKALYLVVNPQVSASIDIPMYGASDADEYQLMSSSYNVTPKRNGTVVTLPAGAYAVYGTMNLLDAPAVSVDDNHTAVRADGDRIVIEGEYENAAGYDLSGRRVDISGSLSAGVYLIDVDGHVTKIIVR